MWGGRDLCVPDAGRSAWHWSPCGNGVRGLELSECPGAAPGAQSDPARPCTTLHDGLRSYEKNQLKSKTSLFFQSLGGQDCGSALQRGCAEHDSGYSRGTAVHLHLRGGRQAQRAQQADHVHPGDPAAQHGVQPALRVRCRPAAPQQPPPHRPPSATAEPQLREGGALPPPAAWRLWGAPSCLSGGRSRAPIRSVVGAQLPGTHNLIVKTNTCTFFFLFF